MEISDIPMEFRGRFLSFLRHKEHWRSNASATYKLFLGPKFFLDPEAHHIFGIRTRGNLVHKILRRFLIKSHIKIQKTV